MILLNSFLTRESFAQEWGYTIADGVGEYFLKTYAELAKIYTEQGRKAAGGGFFRPVKSEWVSPDKVKVERIIGGKKYVVPRPQHGIAHGLRQGFLVVDIVKILNSLDLDDLEPNVDLPESTWQGAIEFIQAFMKDKPELFIKHIQAAASFIKSGRVDELNQGPEYVRGVQRDATNYYKFAFSHKDDTKIYTDMMRFFAAALAYGWGSEPNKELLQLDNTIKDLGSNQYIPYIGDILVAAHRFDLGRLPSVEYIFSNKTSACALMFNAQEEDYSRYPLMQNVCDNLWERAREYLIATGDKHYADDGQWMSYGNKFFIQAQDPHTIIDALEEARANSKITDFFSPLLNRKKFNPSHD
jgi:hypothetical protein